MSDTTTNVVLYSVDQISKYPASRQQGREALTGLEQRIEAQMGLGQAIDVIIDFRAVTAMTYSFTDEFVGKFFAALDAEARNLTVKLVEMNEVNAETVSITMERRNLPVAVLEPGGTMTLFGDSHLQDTFATLTEPLRAAEVAAQLNISPSNANNRLKRLVHVGAVRKQRAPNAHGGKEFMYIRADARVPETEEA